MKFEWEEIFCKEILATSQPYAKKNYSYFSQTFRAKVSGGWILRHEEGEGIILQMKMHSSMLFFPDPNHEWIVKYE